jgi:hypothetical protein
MSKVSGSCLCGRVTFESGAEPKMVAVCHCTHCQKSSGSSYSVNLGMAAEEVTISGPLTIYEDTGFSGMPVLRKFCGTCGSPIVSDVKAFPGLLFIKGGALNDTAWLKPDLDIWTGSAQSWVVHSPATNKFPKNPG